MFFQTQENLPKIEENSKTIYIYENSCNNRKPLELKIGKKQMSFRQIAKLLKFKKLRLFNEEGAQYFQDDLQFVKNNATLYASRGEEFDSTNCFGQYEIIKKLGEGGFGEVFLANHKHSGEKCAIKIIKISSATDIDSIFVQAEILKSLKNENIVKVTNCLTLKNMQVAIIMEYLQGGQLLQYVQKEGKLEQQTCKIFCKQVIKGIQYCHENNLIHRDLKLQNILLVNSEQKKVKIIDFGIAGVMSRLTEEDLDAGSLGYMAPQCFFNDKNYKFDGKMDVWAIGVILFSMLSGQLPFKGSNNFEIRENIKKAHYKIPADVRKEISKECLNVIFRCLDPNPKTRISISELILHDWLSDGILYKKQKKQTGIEKSIFTIEENVESEEKKSPTLQPHKNEKNIQIKSKTNSVYKPKKKGKQNGKIK